jgi:hypothetical protein
MLKGYIEVLVKDADGRIVKYGRHEMHSFLNNFLKFLEAFFKSNGTGTVSMVDTAGNTQTVYGARGDGYLRNHSMMGGLAGDNDDSYGLLVGSGTTTIALTQNALASKISHGTSSGQLDYDPVSVDDYGVDTTVSPPVYRFRLTRAFKNLSGAAITINEVAMAVRHRYYDYGTGIIYDYRFLIARDVLPSSYTVPAGGSATVAVTVEVELG